MSDKQYVRVNRDLMYQLHQEDALADSKRFFLLDESFSRIRGEVWGIIYSG